MVDVMKRLRNLHVLAGALYIGVGLAVMVDQLAHPVRACVVFGAPVGFLPYVLWVWLGLKLVRRSKPVGWLAALSYPVAWLLQENGAFPTPLLASLSAVLYAPLQHATFLVLRLFGTLATWSGHQAALLWCAYLVHLFLLVPLLRAASAARRPAEPRRKPEPTKRPPRPAPPKRPAAAAPAFVAPPETLLYEKNAFRLLGLEPIAPLRVIAKQANEATMLLRASLPLVHKVAPLPHAAPVTEQDVQDAYARLQKDRMAEEVFWFQLGDDIDRQAYAKFVSGDATGARADWQRLAIPSSRKPAAGRAWYNLAVLEHALAVAGARAPAETQPSRDGWANALELWKRVCAEPVCWDYFTKRIGDLSDPGFSRGRLNHSRLVAPSKVLGVNLSVARAALAGGSRELGMQHLKIVKEANYAAEALRGAFVDVFQADLDHLHDAITTLRAAPANAALITRCDSLLDAGQRLAWVANELGLPGDVSAPIGEVVSAVCSRVLQVVDADATAVDAAGHGLRREVNELISRANEAGTLGNFAQLIMLKPQVTAKLKALRGSGILPAARSFCQMARSAKATLAKAKSLAPDDVIRNRAVKANSRVDVLIDCFCDLDSWITSNLAAVS
jgi:hypothetical protein